MVVVIEGRAVLIATAASGSASTIPSSSKAIASTAAITALIAVTGRAIGPLLHILLVLFYRILGRNFAAFGVFNRNLPIVVEGLSLVCLLDSQIGLLAALEEDVGEAARLLRLVVLDDRDVQYGAELGEVLAKLVLSSRLGNACYVNVTVVLRVNQVPLVVGDLFLSPSLLMTASFTLLVVTSGVHSTDPMVAELVLRLRL